MIDLTEKQVACLIFASPFLALCAAFALGHLSIWFFARAERAREARNAR